MAPKAKSFADKGKAPAVPAGKRKRGGDDDDKTGKQRNRAVLQFFEDQAGVGSDYDDDLDSLFGDDDAEDSMEEDFDIELKVKKDSINPQNIPFVPKEEEMDEEEFDRMMEERYKSHPGFKYVEDDEARSLRERGSLLSSAGDPTIWKVKCMVGREKLLTFCLMQKFVDIKALGNKLEIISVFAVDHVKGFIFIEAEKDCYLIEACRGLAGIYYSRVAPVPRSDLPLLLSARKKLNNVEEGMWIRVKSGTYKGDLGQVVAVNNLRRKATVKLIPRIDLQALAQKFGGGVALKRAAAPAPRLISSSELEEFRPLVQYRRDRDIGKVFEVLDGMMLKDGFLYKKISLDSLSYWGVMPSEEELLKFKSSENKNSDDLEWLTQLYGEPRKKRALGNGKGLEKGESSSGSGIQNKFELYELVCFGRKDYGLIVGMEKDDTYKILKDGPDAPMVIFVQVRELKNGPSDMRFTALDQRGKTISVNDSVRILEGSLKDRQGIIKQIYRGTVFIYDDNEMENGGYICCKAQFCEKIKLAFDMSCEKGGVSGAFDFEHTPSSPKSPLPPQTQWQSKQNNDDFKEGGKDSIFSIGQKLRIRVGPLKGYLCRVLAIRYSDVTVKLDSKQKVLQVKSEHLSEVRGKSSTLPTSEVLGSSSFKAFDLLGAEGNSGDWAGGAGTSRDSDGWNTGGVSAEGTSWPAFPASSSVLSAGSDLTNPLSTVVDQKKDSENSAWDKNIAPTQKSSWGAPATDDKAAGFGVQDGGWGKKGDDWKTASKAMASDLCSSWDAPAAGEGNQVGWGKKSDDGWSKAAQEDGSKQISSWGVQSTDNNAAADDGNPVPSWRKRGEGWNAAAKEVTSDRISSLGVPAVVDEDLGCRGSWVNQEGESSREKLDGESSAGRMSATSSSWGKQAGQSAWSTRVEESSWNKQGEESKWAKQGGGSARSNQEGGSSWNNKGRESSWNKQEGGCSWKKQDENQNTGWNEQGGESTGTKQEGGSSWNKLGGEFSWSKPDGGSSWNKQCDIKNVGWSKQGGESSWATQGGESSWAKQGGESSWAKQGEESSWAKQEGESTGTKLDEGSSWTNKVEESSWSKLEGGSSWNQQGNKENGGQNKQGGERDAHMEESSWNKQDTSKDSGGWN